MATEKAKAMGIDLIKRGIIKPVCLAFSHPFLLSTASFVVVIYKYRPSIFGFLVSSSPVIGCALVFLWILLKSGKDGGGGDGGGGNVNRSLQLRRRRRKTMGSSNGDNASGVGCSSRRTKMERFAAFDETSSDSEDDAVVIGPILDTGTTDGLLSESESETLSMENEEEEEEEVRDGKVEAESVMKWTADDEKNVRDVRTSELERNRKLEHLMSMRRSMNYRRSRSDDEGDGREKRLIDFDNETSKAAAVEEELDRILPVALIVPRKNPFDSDGEEEEHAEADAPGSAPSVLIPRMNPFDVEADDDDHGFAGTSNGAAAVNRHHRQGGVEAAGFLRRNETFTLGVSLSDHNRYERRISRFRPYFVPERIGSDGTSYSVLHRQMSGITAETESVVSSVSDHSSSSHVDLVIHSDDDDEIHGVISRFTISSHTEDDDYDDEEEEEEDKAIRNSTSSDSSVALVIADSDADAHHQPVEPVYDSSPTEIDTPESNSASIEIEAEALVYLKKDNHRLITESEELAAADFYNDSVESDGVVPTPAAAALNPRRLLPWNTAKEAAKVEGLLVPPSPPSNFADVERPIEIMPTIIEDDLDESRHDEDEDDDVTTMKDIGIPETTNIPSKDVIIASI